MFQHRIWQQLAPGDSPDRLAHVIQQLRLEDNRFHVEGGSWTNDLSWVRGYDQVLIPMEQASALFHERILAPGVPADDPRYRKALFHLLAAETSCYRYWGQGIWTDYGAELSRRVADLLAQDP
jgi:hypothetical protein